MNIQVIQDRDLAIEIIRHVGAWLRDTHKANYSKWWDPDKLTAEFLGQYARPEEFYVIKVDGKPAAASVIQPGETQIVQDWSSIDEGASPKAIYLAWVAVEREFAGHGLVARLIEKTEELARQKGCDRLRLDTYAGEPKLRDVYESLGFRLVGTAQEQDHTTAFYEKRPSKR